MINILDNQDIGISIEHSNADLKLRQCYASAKDTQRKNEETTASITEDDKSLKFAVKKGIMTRKGSATHRSTANMNALREK